MNDTEMHNIELQPCCKKSIQNIRNILWANKALGPALVACSLLSILFGPPDDPGISSIQQIKQTDWNMLAEAVKSVSPFCRRQIKTLAGAEVIKHIGKVKFFWEGVYDKFNVEL